MRNINLLRILFSFFFLSFIIVNSYAEEESMQELINRISNSYNITFNIVHINHSTNTFNSKDVLILKSVKELENFVKYISSSPFETEKFLAYTVLKNRLTVFDIKYNDDEIDEEKKNAYVTRGADFKFNHESYGTLKIQPTFEFGFKSKSISNFKINFDEKSNFYTVKLINTKIEDVVLSFSKITYNFNIIFNFLGSLPINKHIYTGSMTKQFIFIIDKKTGKITSFSYK